MTIESKLEKAMKKRGGAIGDCSRNGFTAVDYEEKNFRLVIKEPTKRKIEDFQHFIGEQPSDVYKGLVERPEYEYPGMENISLLESDIGKAFALIEENKDNIYSVYGNFEEAYAFMREVLNLEPFPIERDSKGRMEGGFYKPNFKLQHTSNAT